MELIPDEAEKQFIAGKIEAIFFQNPSNFYKVLLVSIADTNTDFLEKEIVVTGSFGDIQEEEPYRFFGHFTDHPRYGRQFQVDSYRQERPTSANGVVAYLSSDKFPGIGKRTAEKIVETLGEEAIDRIIEEPDLLQEIPQLNEKKRALILDTIRLNHGMEQVIVGLSRYGFGSQLAFTIYQTYKEDTLSIIQENPYQLVEDIEGIGFKRADNMAEQLGIRADSDQRVRAAITHEVFQHSVRTGDTYVEAEVLLNNSIQLLEGSRPVEISPDQAANQIIHLVEEGKIQQEGTKLFENSLYFSEWGIGTSIQRLLSRKKEILYDPEEVEKDIRIIEKQQGILYGESQQNAIEEAIKSPLFILTGGPGTGKTTVINGIVSLFAELNGISLDLKDYTQEMFPIHLAAPTGRAAKRMNETTGLNASTIHRLLGLTGREKNPTMSAKELEGGLLIIDEMSMVDTWLANTLFKAIPTNMQVILVGDKDQLPSVGPGQVLHDLLQIEEIPSIELTEIYRQGDGSSIVPLAHEIRQGKLPSDFTINQKDRSFFASDAYHIETYVKQIVTKAKLKGFTAQDIQLLAPMYRGVAGIDALNKMMQEIFNPNDGTKKEVSWNDTVYRIGDKVLHLVNSPEVNVFNGDMGEVVGIIPAKESDDKVDELVLQFDNTEVSYKRNEWNKITLSYCCSIHKSQGSEFKMVILPIVRQYNRMLQRNLLYTAVTRSKDILILLGEINAFQECVNRESASRMTTLKQRILDAGGMTLTLRTQLEAYEEGLMKESPFTEVEESSEREAVSSKAPVLIEEESAIYTVETGKKREESKSDQSISLFDVAEPEKEIVEKIETEIEWLLTPHLASAQTIDPMIGMNGVTPSDFLTE
ncbi:ATP-dependent RecD-like DNA helicase [Enterococcus sp. BWB1-3]|uniref:SF1B family DNA helicase RecD2 n=1 Tax=Enterococcus sp. BWB1-3 TaxID=2787713 RepID=UPI0019250ACF|nr:ATP-dependent RecD-like DNA helicase [Enterococcus sp. BWB1-3]MBL1229793.1 ATP-dependent RecD-like DNA helicase [Enterococcus sp. BWB1-3]